MEYRRSRIVLTYPLCNTKDLLDRCLIVACETVTKLRHVECWLSVFLPMRILADHAWISAEIVVHIVCRRENFWCVRRLDVPPLAFESVFRRAFESQIAWGRPRVFLIGPAVWIVISLFRTLWNTTVFPAFIPVGGVAPRPFRVSWPTLWKNKC